MEDEVVAHAVIGAAIEVHRVLGPGYPEGFYEEALAVELALRGLRYARQVPVCVRYKGHVVGEGRMDLLVEDRIVVELKVTDGLSPLHVAQTTSYLKATDRRLGLLITFNVLLLRSGIKRVIWTR